MESFMISRLATIAPDLEAAIANARPSLRRRIASVVSSWAADRVGWSYSADAGSLSEILQELDQRYFALQELRESGGCSEAAVMAAFNLARAVSSAVFASEEQASEAAYEAVMATGDLSGVRRVVLSILSGTSPTT
jgi:hypothetical protein